jgi:hypothetical protein
MQEKFYDATRAYNRSLRWGDFDRASEYLPEAAIDRFLDQHEEVSDDLVILDYRMTRLKLDRQTGKAASRVEVEWHTDRRLIVETTVVDQKWQFWEGDWYLVDERRARGKPLAVFAEIPEDDEGEPVPDSVHPYLPGLEGFRKTHEIGLTPKQKRLRDRDRRRAKRRSDTRGTDPMASQPPADDWPGT